MRVGTAFNKMLGIVGATVASVTFTPAGIVVGLRRRRARLVCPCGWKTWAVYDRSTRRWRHLDLAGSKLWLEAEICRVDQACDHISVALEKAFTEGVHDPLALERELRVSAGRFIKSATGRRPMIVPVVMET